MSVRPVVPSCEFTVRQSLQSSTFSAVRTEAALVDSGIAGRYVELMTS
jgi:hypothetical protein